MDIPSARKIYFYIEDFLILLSPDCGMQYTAINWLRRYIWQLFLIIFVYIKVYLVDHMTFCLGSKCIHFSINLSVTQVCADQRFFVCLLSRIMSQLVQYSGNNTKTRSISFIVKTEKSNRNLFINLSTVFVWTHLSYCLF